MQKKILIAVDKSAYAKNAVRYAARLCLRVEQLGYVLFTIQPMVSLFLEEEARRSPAARAKLERVSRRNAEECQAVLETLKAEMTRMGIAAKRITTVHRPHSQGVAKDIIEYAQQSLLDAIVVGRRGMTALQAVFMGSVSSAVAQNSGLIPVWLVDADLSPSKILLAVDGSEASLRAVDHLAFVLGGDPHLQLTLFHVRPRLRSYCEIDFSPEERQDLETAISRGDHRCIDHFYASALKKLAQSGIAEDRIQIKTVSGLFNPGAEIVKEIKAGGHDTVVMGRRGISRSFFTGSVTNHVINQAQECAVWIVP